MHTAQPTNANARWLAPSSRRFRSRIGSSFSTLKHVHGNLCTLCLWGRMRTNIIICSWNFPNTFEFGCIIAIRYYKFIPLRCAAAFGFSMNNRLHIRHRRTKQTARAQCWSRVQKEWLNINAHQKQAEWPRGLDVCVRQHGIYRLYRANDKNADFHEKLKKGLRET